MKKRWMALMALAMVLVLGACGGGAKKEVSKTVRNTMIPGITLEITYFAEGDRVTRQTANNKIVYAEAGTDKATIQKSIDPVAAQYKGLAGITHSVEYTDTEAIEKLEIDFSKVEYEKVKSVQGIMLTADPKTTPISLEKSVEMLTKEGWTEVEATDGGASSAAASEQAESSSSK